MTSSTNLMDEFESSFQACLAALTNPSNNHIHDADEIKTGVEQTIQRFLDIARQMECFFLQKRLLLSVEKPEQIILEDINELKAEIARKDQILQKYYEKLQYWQGILNETSGATPNPLSRQSSLTQQQPNVAASEPPQPPGHPITGAPHTPPAAGLQHMPLRQPPPSAIAQNQPPQHMMQAQGPLQSQHPVMASAPQGPGMQMATSPGAAGPGMMPMQSVQHHGAMMPPPPPPQGAMAAQHQAMMNQGPPPPQMSQFMGQQTHPGGLQGPLAFLERTTSNIGMPDPRR